MTKPRFIGAYCITQDEDTGMVTIRVAGKTTLMGLSNVLERGFKTYRPQDPKPVNILELVEALRAIE